MSPVLEVFNVRNGAWYQRGKTPVLPPETFDIAAGATRAQIQTVLNSKPNGATVKLQVGNYDFSDGGKLDPKFQQVVVGPSTPGDYANFRGDIALTGWVQDGARWYVPGVLPPTYSENSQVQCEINTGTGANPCHKREQVWYDGVHLTRVMTLAEVTTGKFYQDFAADRTYIGDDPNGHTVRMSATRVAISSSVNGVRLSKIKVSRFASVAQTGAVVISGDDWIIDNCLFTENHAIGLHLTTSDRTQVRNNIFTKNGQLGMAHHRSVNTIIEYNQFTNNNTDGFWGADWESGGFKATYSNGTIFRYNLSDDNEGCGIWFDIDNINITLGPSNTSTNNYADGIRYEISYAGEIFENFISGNGYRYANNGGRGADYSLLAVAGININTSSDVRVHDNVLGPNQNGIGAQFRTRGPSSTTGLMWDLVNLEVHHNDVQLTTGGTKSGEGVSGIRTQGQTDSTMFFDERKNNRFHDNTYTVIAATDARFAWDQKYMSFSAAQALGYEVGSTIRIAPRPGVRVTAGGNDGHFTMASTSAFTNTGTTALVGDFDATNYGRAAFLRFEKVTIPRGATITAAKFEVRAVGVDTAIPAMTVMAHLSPNSPVPANRTEMVSRPRTTAKVPWVPATWTAATWIDSPSIVSVIQELVNQSTWESGSAITLLVQPQTISWTTQKRVSFRTHEYATNEAAGLIVTWS